LARLRVEQVHKQYPGVKALDGIDLEVKSGEFFTLLGPSGCGKTTLLRTIAGFNRHDSGRILVDGDRIDTTPAHRRNIGMVYQDYAIFPHMTVGENVGFGLQMRRLPRAEIEQRVERALALVQLAGYGKRLPNELSGGQQQRVALARAVVINPRILLMDEPLSNLDAKLRIELREDIRDLQRSLGATTIYVTHDQEEALVISDRICIMQSGRVHQIGSPQDVYIRPATLFVASFVGAMNLLSDAAAKPDALLAALAHKLPPLAGRRGITLAIRPEHVQVSDRAAPGGEALIFDAAVTKVTYAGHEAYYRLRSEGGSELIAHVYRPDHGALATAGDRLRVSIPIERLHAFESEAGTRVELGA
jgi:ABC-type Fe3+/spermidine/putrescine transport system ATPase subunit